MEAKDPAWILLELARGTGGAFGSAFLEERITNLRRAWLTIFPRGTRVAITRAGSAVLARGTVGATTRAGCSVRAVLARGTVGARTPAGSAVLARGTAGARSRACSTVLARVTVGAIFPARRLLELASVTVGARFPARRLLELARGTVGARTPARILLGLAPGTVGARTLAGSAVLARGTVCATPCTNFVFYAEKKKLNVLRVFPRVTGVARSVSIGSRFVLAFGAVLALVAVLAEGGGQSPAVACALAVPTVTALDI